MATKQANSKKKSSKAVNVELEKLTEQIPAKPAIPQVAPEVLASIKSSAQIEEEEHAKRQQVELEIMEKQLKNRLIFYGGLACAVGIAYLVHRFYTGPAPPKELVHELVNGAVSVIPQ
jgi:hypothetical protein